MSVVLVHFDCTLPLMTPSAIELSIFIGVDGCLCPSASSMIWMYTTSCAIIYKPGNCASVADSITCLMLCAVLRMATLFSGVVVSLERKNDHPLGFGIWDH